MSTLPTPSSSSGQNQSILELIYALKGLAQALEYMHSDLRRLLEEEGRDRDRELEKIVEIIGKNAQALAVLPITISDRIERIVDKLEGNVDKKVDGVLEDVRVSLGDVRTKLWKYMQDKVDDAAPKPVAEDVTGRITLLGGGNVKVEGSFNATKAAKTILVIKWAVLGLAASGGVAGIIKLFYEAMK